ncbi:hypothetical protein BKA04_000484 [Cryobacterium mesophilum]|uniref:DUF4870 domain-containing protein n=1 Tax=Terrimesophilobacter mesophilus TaxID=433647 RepID=A0A4R8VAQ7_9MICO|nr:DUF4870 domain-containing protein [Terrimesophilobacter mesophilus]MBB5632261.1 hypothetical protein [Terrimesophilobacter mesophilus]TFB79112.1 DUF4870 domain-containing protein [Terrimesophilobacter mesophilus]
MSESMPPPVNPYQTVQPLSPSDEKLWAILVHLGGIFFGFLPALIGYLVLKDRGPFIRQHTGSALNFQLTMLIASIVGAILIIAIVGIFIIIAVSIVVIIFSILAAVAANKGEAYEYPLAIKFIK